VTSPSSGADNGPPRSDDDASRPPRGGQPAGERAKPPARPKSARRRSREFALQGLYEWLLSGSEVGLVMAHMREQEGFDKCDAVHFDALLQGCIEEAGELDAVLARHVDRPTQQLSPVEHGVLLIGAYELKRCMDVPYKVAINEAVELTKAFGGTDGHKYVNGVLDKAAIDLRPQEVPARRPR
jgi:transcription antitermination protein NusB